jgi:hypothetical protein
MKIISHRGNIKGPNPEDENKQWYIDAAIEMGYDVEVDVWYVDDEFYLGHDGPEYQIDLSWLVQRSDVLWIHCKNLDAAHALIMFDAGLRCFCSISDPFCFITEGYLWLNDVDVEPTNNCVVPLLNIDDLKSYKFMGKPWGICTDHPYRAREISSE